MLKVQKEIRMQKVLENHKNQIFRICWGFSEIKEDVEDLYQEILLNIWRSIGDFKANSSLNTWIYRVSVNTCLLWKRKSKLKLNQIEEKEHASMFKSESVENLLIKNEILDALIKAIHKLKSEEKIIALFLLEELSYKEIAQIIGTNENNIGVKVYRIKEKLKKILK